MVSANSSSHSSSAASRLLPPSALTELEEHDDALASLCPTGTMDSAAFSVDSNHTSFSSICCFDREDLDRIGHLGSGKYCKVDVVSACSNNSTVTSATLDSSCSSHERSDNSNTNHNATGNGNGNPHLLAHKSIDPCRLRCPTDLNIAATELANEAKMLSGLDHPNIIKLRGLPNEKFSESFRNLNTNTKCHRRDDSESFGYFLVMDLLHETLKDRMNTWNKKEKELARASKRREMLRKTRKSLNKRLRKSFSKSNHQSSSSSCKQDCKQLHNRVRDTVLGIAKGMKYLHSKGIVLRDLKPANIGYEQDESDSRSSCPNTSINNSNNSNVKLFDFGMARKVDECEAEEICGSPRYMAPEVMLKKGYSTSVDVYSFGVILYEMCSLKHPFDETYASYRKAVKAGKRPRTTVSSDDVSVNPIILDFYNAVANEKIKPSADLEHDVVCPKLRCLIEACWDHNLQQRPTFDTILLRLDDIFVSPLVPTVTNQQADSKEHRDRTLRPSVSIEFLDFDESFDELSCSGRSANNE